MESPTTEVTDYSTVHPLFLATDTANMQAGSDSSLLERTGIFTKAAALSGIASIYNTGANLLGAEQWDVARWMEENDAHLGQYYVQNKEFTDLAGFIGTSLIPGGLALKGVQLAKAGTMLGPFGRALGYASTKQKLYLEQGLKELATEGGTVFNLINKNKLAAMGWEVADQAINVATFETAIALTMKQSPLLEKDEWSDVFKHVVYTSAAFGAIGGAIGSIAINSIFKQGTKTIDAALREFDVVKHIEGDIVLGDKAFGTVKSILELPTVGRDIEFTYRIGGEERKLQLPTKQAIERASDSAIRRGWDDFRETVNKMTGGDNILGNQFSDYVFEIVKKEQQAGRSMEEVLDRVGDHLLDIKSIRRVSPEAVEGERNIFYVPKEITAEQVVKIHDFNSFLTEVVSRSPRGKDTAKTPYELVSTKDEVQVALVGLKQEAPIQGTSYARFSTVEEAWASNYDAAVLANGTIRINPKSGKFRKIDDPILAPRSFFNTRTGAFTDTAFPTVADIASSTKPLAMTAMDHLVSGGRSWNFKPFESFEIGNIDSLDASARYVYAKEVKVVPQKISDTDIPMLERIFQDGAEKWKDVVLKSADNSERKVSSISDFGAWLKDQKLQILQGFLARTPKGEDLVSLGVKLNVEPVWVQDAIIANFLSTEKLSIGFSVPLSKATRPQNMEVIWDFAHSKELESSLLGKSSGKAPTDVLVQGMPDAVGNTIYGELAWAYRVKLGNDARNSAFAAVMGAEDAVKFVELNADTVMSIANQAGSGAGLVKSSNADYGDVLGLWSQYTGTLVHEMGRRNANATLTELQPLMISIKDKPKAAAELGIFDTAMRRTPEKFMIDPQNSKRLVNIEAVEKGSKESGVAWAVNEAKLLELEKAGRRHQFIVEIDDVAEFIGASHAANVRRIEKMRVLMTSRGWNYNYDTRIVYVPPVDTGRYPYFAFVRRRPEFLGTSSEVSIVTARTEQELLTLTNKVPDDYEVIFKENSERFHKIKGDYDYQLTIKEPTIDSTLQRRGILGDFFPETRAENVLDDYINWHQRQEVRVVRSAVETKYAQTIEELRGIGKQFTELGTSKVGAGLRKFRSQIENPFTDYVKTALDISKRGEYTLLHEANEFVEQLGKTAYRTFEVNREKAMAGTVSWQEANKISERFGIKGPYSDEIGYFKANLPEERSLIKDYVAKANMTLVNSNIRLDWANSAVNIISTPILLATEMASIRHLASSDPALIGKLAELRSIPVPGTNGILRIPSTIMLGARGIGNFFGPEKEALIARYRDIGAVREVVSMYHEMLDHFAYKPYVKASELGERARRGIETAAKFTGNRFSEDFTRFVSADVMRQLTDPLVTTGKMSIAEQNAYIVTHVNRVQGNYISSQRPIAFQGVIGSAIGLFMTYQFNFLQQLFRHIENKNTRALAVMAGMQGGTYGLHGIPFFEAVNNTLIGNSDLNPGHKDVYSTMPQVLNREIGNWLMYGTASAFPFWSSQAPSLYTRGDINPRHISIIPITPLDIPAVDGSIRFVTNLADMGKKMVKGADLTSVLFEGLEHNGLSRPLAGIAQVAQGYSTTSKGSLISASNDLFSIATMARAIGSKPVDESIALNAKFRLASYEAADQVRLQTLGEVIKTKLRAGKLPSIEELQTFQLAYAKAGGRIENYSKTLQRWSRDANVSVINQLAQQHRSSYSQRLQEIMGGTTINDFRTMQLALPPPASQAAGENQ